MTATGYDLQHVVAHPVEDAASDTSRQFVEIWQDKAGDRFAPSREEIDWLELPMDVVSRIMIVDVLPAPLDFRYRYFGTWHVDCHGRDMTGRCVSDYEDTEYRAFVMRDYANVLEARAPTLSTVSMVLRDLPYRCEILRLPLSSDGRTVDKIMVVESELG